MRFLSHIAGVLMVAAACVACNDEVFVVKLTPSSTVLNFDEEGGQESVKFNTGEWNVTGICLYGADPGSYFILEGGREYSIWPPSLEGEGKLLIKDGSRVVVALSRSSSESLELSVGENFSTDRRILTVLVSNDLFRKEIRVFQSANSWALSGFEWDAASATCEIESSLSSYPLTVDNKGNEDLVVKLDVFGNCSRTVQFLENGRPGKLSPDFPDPDASVVVPDGITEDGALLFGTLEAKYAGGLQEFESGLPQVEKDVAFKPGKHTYVVLVEYKKLTVNYTARFTTGNGRHESETGGTLVITSPTGKWYGIWKD